ncbi:Uncharacterised protein [Mycobacterium tuberculosis]|nr:Uncharacterised protein [Mycobacterium tuberculosis]CKU61778.1 Uncharacterised protein [Mycobacterium tuberculosis]
MLAVGHRDSTEVPAGRTRQVHVPASDHRHLRGGRGEPVRIRKRIVHAGGVGILGQTSLHLTEPHAGSFVECPIRHHDVSHPGGHCHSGVLHGRTCGATAVVDLGEERQLADAGRTRHGDFGVGVHRERGQPVDIGRAQARIGQRIQHRLGRQPQLTSTGVLRKVGGADTDDGRLTR